MGPQLITLLKAVSEDQRELRLASFGEAQIRWAIATGLGPVLFQAINADALATASPYWSLLKGADLTARVLTCEQLDAMSEILDACDGRIHTLTLLKGISICDQHYPEPHLRLMRDIDFLVDEAELSTVGTLLSKLGYGQPSTLPSEFYQTHHHIKPFFNPQKDIWVEVHRGLFPGKNEVSHDKVFALENVKAQLQTSKFQGRRVSRLGNELQVVYIASHWASDFNVVGGMVALLDIIYLLKNAKDEFNWQQILKWVDDSVASAHLYLILSYIDKYRLIDIAPEVLDELSSKQRSLKNLNLGVMHGVIDRYFVGEKPFGQILSERNLSILWKILLLWESQSRNLLLGPWNVLLPNRFRTRSQF
jgi:hypothetical protein